MSDPISPDPASAAANPPVTSVTEPTTAAPEGLQPNVAAALSCIPVVGGIIFLILEKKNKFVRFFAAQSLVFSVAAIAYSVAFAILFQVIAFVPGIRILLIPIFVLVSWVVNLVFLAIVIVTIVKAFTNKEWEIPYLGPIARKQLESGLIAKYLS